MDAPADQIVYEAYPADALLSWNGFRALGYNLFICFISMVLIHGAFSFFTWGTLLPDPFFRLKIKNMHKAIHGLDSHTYSRRGLWNGFNFNEIFRWVHYDKMGQPFEKTSDTNQLLSRCTEIRLTILFPSGKRWVRMPHVFRVLARSSISTFTALYRGNFDPFDPSGWTANALEWVATYLLLLPEDGRMKKEDVKGVFNGTIFYKIADENKQKKRIEIEAAQERRRIALEKAEEQKRIAYQKAEERERTAAVKVE
ncbi:hypothetical protein FRB94_001001 [Tulasnella sp. JGI-2019a]|nr:hypothetical protein FRB94_001001 [Tulasnella sp. JGI-2019a]